jgi:AdoMet-dependent heme synthase
MNPPSLRLVAFEVTRTCTLSCRHCRGDSRQKVYKDELGLNEIRTIIDNIASFAKPILIITGGEPLTRPDVYEIALYSSSLGLRTVLATCGHFLNDETVSKLVEAGVSRISISLDGASAVTHDQFRGTPGAFEATLSGIAAARRNHLDFQINSTLTVLNIAELESIHDLALSLGAVGFHPFLLVPVGRGKELAGLAIPPEEYEKTLVKIAHIAETSPLEIKPTCSPHFTRICLQMKNTQSKSLSVSRIGLNCEKGHSVSKGNKSIITRGCLGGHGFVFISHRGKVQICGFLDSEAGNLRKTGYNLQEIWNSAPLFREIRDKTLYKGKCGICEYFTICGGCRARAYYSSGDYLGDEPNCEYLPGGIQ